MTVRADWTWHDIGEGADIIKRMGPVIMSTTRDNSGVAAALFRNWTGNMVGLASDYIADGSFTHRLIISLTLARMAGATMQTLSLVRKAAFNESPKSIIAIGIKYTFMLIGIAQESIISTITPFTSRNDAAAMMQVMMAAFDQIEDAMGDETDLDQSLYNACVGLHGAMAKQFYQTELLLPRMMQYRYQTVHTSLRMSQLNYGDGTHSDELRLENKVVHPAFMPRQGRLLATER
jgi:prophage DNA circulation protein